jgi:hypothetical protein
MDTFPSHPDNAAKFLELELVMPEAASSYIDLLLTRAPWDREAARNWAIKYSTFWHSMGYLWADEPDARLSWASGPNGGTWNDVGGGHDGDVQPISESQR